MLLPKILEIVTLINGKILPNNLVTLVVFISLKPSVGEKVCVCIVVMIIADVVRSNDHN